MTADVAVIGAGISGLALARDLHARGRRALVLERARGVGGRCATRRIDGQPVDHGVAYLHGRSDRFRSEIEALATDPSISGWPRVRDGTGVPCQPEAFEAHEFRIAPAEGVSRLAKRLAQALDVRLHTRVVALRPEVKAGNAPGWELTLDSGERLRARVVALTQPAPWALALLRTLEPLPEDVAGILPLLELVRTLPCLTVIARYAGGVTPPPWDASFPATSKTIHTILHDSSKRAGRARLTLVIQARPRFSRGHLSDPAEHWTRMLLDEAASLHGDWAARPEHVQSHAWHHARVDAPSSLAGPIMVQVGDGAVLGISGDGLHSAGGVEGAFLSGLALAERIAATPPSVIPN